MKEGKPREIKEGRKTERKEDRTTDKKLQAIIPNTSIVQSIIGEVKNK